MYCLIDMCCICLSSNNCLKYLSSKDCKNVTYLEKLSSSFQEMVRLVIFNTPINLNVCCFSFSMPLIISRWSVIYVRINWISRTISTSNASIVGSYWTIIWISWNPSETHGGLFRYPSFKSKFQTIGRNEKSIGVKTEKWKGRNRNISIKFKN